MSIKYDAILTFSNIEMAGRSNFVLKILPCHKEVVLLKWGSQVFYQSSLHGKRRRTIKGKICLITCNCKFNFINISIMKATY